jgi:hypothetical protein
MKYAQRWQKSGTTPWVPAFAQVVGGVGKDQRPYATAEHGGGVA